MTVDQLIATIAARCGRQLTDAEVAQATESFAAKYNAPGAVISGGTGFLRDQIEGKPVDHITASMLT